MIFSIAATILSVSASVTAGPLASIALRQDPSVAISARAKSRTALSLPSEPYGILTSGPPIRNRMLTRVNAKSLSSKESDMLDIAFVALGIAVLALMGAYALALRDL